MTAVDRSGEPRRATAAPPTVQDDAQRRRALRRLAVPVSVLTVCHEGRPHGTTVSTVTTCSHEPLLLGASLRGGSSFAELAAAAGRFVVNVLNASQADVARWFADRARPAGLPQFAGLSGHDDPYAGAPLLDGALATYSCQVFGRSAVGDHELLLGLVTHASVGEGDPLLSYTGGLFAGSLSPAPVSGPGPRNRKEKVAP
ncbi:flavin reductase family protein [Streptomyces sp. SL13]|uniref:Flavin reductase family protein n=1 Tax=Streptantibioticus silvisoli TaxID=2705255 RepID=A0AA90GVZ6_9ACTN|nr:flavin reductase family protein [Streptantibioticus silvisoli]MDI5962473.1 flavin reductase family protein [Streptantibioticus silvisoli]MDI5969108.1 flavin reductase family protein [Streptantibioticus silvisoli]